MQTQEAVLLKRDVEASIIPIGTKVTLKQGEQAYITQALGGSYTVVVQGNMFRIESKDADALGFDAPAQTTATATGAAAKPEDLEKQAWDAMKTCYDPEIPVNIVDLGLIYDCKLTPVGEGSNRERAAAHAVVCVRPADPFASDWLRSGDATADDFHPARGRDGARKGAARATDYVHGGDHAVVAAASDLVCDCDEVAGHPAI